MTNITSHDVTPHLTDVVTVLAIFHYVEEEATVRYSTADGSALAGQDYISVSSELVTFPPRVKMQSVYIRITDDQASFFFQDGRQKKT